uniref:Uncharacterized protein n=1 Tax=Plectus sambesii TaxID=2011161 RepID=A0A914WCF0_9BILA
MGDKKERRRWEQTYGALIDGALMGGALIVTVDEYGGRTQAGRERNEAEERLERRDRLWSTRLPSHPDLCQCSKHGSMMQCASRRQSPRRSSSVALAWPAAVRRSALLSVGHYAASICFNVAACGSVAVRLRRFGCDGTAAGRLIVFSPPSVCTLRLRTRARANLMGTIHSRLHRRRSGERAKGQQLGSTDGGGGRSAPRRRSSFARICRWGSKRLAVRRDESAADAKSDDAASGDHPPPPPTTSFGATDKPSNVPATDDIVCDPNHLAAPPETWKSPRNSVKDRRRASDSKNCNEVLWENTPLRPSLSDHSDNLTQDDLTQELLMQIIRCFPFPSPKPSPRSSPKLAPKEPHRRVGSLNFRRRHNNDKRGSKEEPASLKPPRNKVLPPDAVSEKFRDSNSALHQLAQVGRSGAPSRRWRSVGDRSASLA